MTLFEDTANITREFGAQITKERQLRAYINELLDALDKEPHNVTISLSDTVHEILTDLRRFLRETNEYR